MSRNPELPVELIEHILQFAWDEARTWPELRRDHLSFSLVSSTWKDVLVRVSSRSLYTDLYPPGVLNQRMDAQDELNSSPRGHTCRFASFRIGHGHEVESFLQRANEVFSQAPRVVHARFDFTKQHEQAWAAPRQEPEPLSDIVLRALEHAPSTLSTLSVLCGCPSAPWNQVSGSSRQRRISFPNITRLSLDCDDVVFVLDMVARCPNITSLRLTCAYGALARLQALTPHLHTLTLFLGPHPPVRLSSHLPFTWKRSPIDNWQLVAAIQDRVLFSQSPASAARQRLVEIELPSPERGLSETESRALASACEAAGVRVQYTTLPAAEAPCFHAHYLINGPGPRHGKANKLAAFIMP
ncbi:hypothetical protein AURDEDRAFT_153699 [Auricularia subglabra TFB-10046 SS5]|nr:hypothetical protein AURDEDRAFT_153699 [Auricularia subglabra TFB-10046 SS5]